MSRYTPEQEADIRRLAAPRPFEPDFEKHTARRAEDEKARRRLREAGIDLEDAAVELGLMRDVTAEPIAFAKLGYADRLREAFRGIKAAAIEHGCPAEVGAAIAYFEVVERNPPTPSNAPSSAWMEAVARAAIAAFVADDAWLDELGGDMPIVPIAESVERAVAHAMTTPPPAGPGGPNDG